METSSTSQADPSSQFFKHWQDTFSRVWQAAGTFTPDTMPPEMMRQVRSGIFQALAKSWEEFMRSPQFLEGAKQMMDNAITFRQMTNDFLTKARQEMQGTSRQDVDDVLLAMREMESRLSRRMDDLSSALAASADAKPPRPNPPKAKPRKTAARKTAAPKTARKPSRKRK